MAKLPPLLKKMCLIGAGWEVRCVVFYHWISSQDAFDLGECGMGLFYAGWFWTWVFFFAGYWNAGIYLWLLRNKDVPFTQVVWFVCGLSL